MASCSPICCRVESSRNADRAPPSDLERELFACDAHANRGAISEASGQERVCQRVLKMAQNAALDRARAERRFVAALDQVVFRGIIEVEFELALAEQTLEMAELNLDYLAQVLLGQRTENQGFVDAVQKLGAEELFQPFEQDIAQCVASGFALEQLGIAVQDPFGADIAGHDHDGV